LDKTTKSPFSYCQYHTSDGISNLAHVFITQGNKKESKQQEAFIIEQGGRLTY
jgi:hypothetical protein